MNVNIDLQNFTDITAVPSQQQFEQWVNAVLQQEDQQGIVSINLVNAEKSQALNKEYRHQEKPTNVLAFPYNAHNIIGDLII
ncbi:unnamed protein product, partial [marine sediment metagenome]